MACTGHQHVYVQCQVVRVIALFTNFEAEFPALPVDINPMFLHLRKLVSRERESGLSYPHSRVIFAPPFEVTFESYAFSNYAGYHMSRYFVTIRSTSTQRLDFHSSPPPVGSLNTAATMYQR